MITAVITLLAIAASMLGFALGFWLATILNNKSWVDFYKKELLKDYNNEQQFK